MNYEVRSLTEGQAKSPLRGLKSMNKKAQTILEYMVLLVIVLAALLAIANYVKRGMQGRWKEATDGLGDQYDPRAANSSVRHTLVQDTRTAIIATPTTDNGVIVGWSTDRTDETISTERKQGSTTVGSY